MQVKKDIEGSEHDNFTVNLRQIIQVIVTIAIGMDIMNVLISVVGYLFTLHVQFGR